MSLVVFAFTLPDQEASVLEALVAPSLAQLEQLGVASSMTTEQSVTYVEHFDKYLGLLPFGKETMYGPNYDRVLEIKDTYDPGQLLYGIFDVGSDAWTIDDGGRLCRK